MPNFVDCVRLIRVGKNAPLKAPTKTDINWAILYGYPGFKACMKSTKFEPCMADIFVGKEVFKKGTPIIKAEGEIFSKRFEPCMTDFFAGKEVFKKGTPILKAEGEMFSKHI